MVTKDRQTATTTKESSLHGLPMIFYKGKRKQAHDTLVWVVAVIGAALEEGVALVEGAPSVKMMAVILEEYFLASSRKVLMLMVFLPLSLARANLVPVNLFTMGHS
jgi:hypothetical protein